MPLSTSVRRSAALAALTAVAGSAALAGSASAATVVKEPVLAPGATIPVDFPGYKEPASNRLKANYRIVAVRATLGRDEKVQTIVSAPKGFELVTLGIPEGANVGLRAENDYVGKRSVRLTLFVNRAQVAPGEQVSATIYALARRAS
jgi:hypothetical protein